LELTQSGRGAAKSAPRAELLASPDKDDESGHCDEPERVLRPRERSLTPHLLDDAARDARALSSADRRFPRWGAARLGEYA